jgi:hypothetical protein
VIRSADVTAEAVTHKATDRSDARNLLLRGKEASGQSRSDLIGLCHG